MPHYVDSQTRIPNHTGDSDDPEDHLETEVGEDEVYDILRGESVPMDEFMERSESDVDVESILQI